MSREKIKICKRIRKIKKKTTGSNFSNILMTWAIFLTVLKF